MDPQANDIESGRRHEEVPADRGPLINHVDSEFADRGWTMAPDASNRGQTEDSSLERVQPSEAITYLDSQNQTVDLCPPDDLVSLDSGNTMRRFVYQMLLMKDLETDTEPMKTKKALLRYALEEFKAKLKTFEERMTQLNTEARNEKNEVYQLVSLFSVVAGVVLTVVSTSSRLECQHLWSPIGICALSYLLIIVVTNVKVLTIWELQRQHALYRERRQGIMSCLRMIETRPFNDLDFQKHIDPIMNGALVPDISFRSFLLKYSLPLTIFLTIFSAGLVVSCVQILCWT